MVRAYEPPEVEVMVPLIRPLSAVGARELRCMARREVVPTVG